jgi:hypothetical protein
MEHRARRTNFRWGVFRQETENDVAPCDHRGRMAAGHVLGTRCRCKPRVQHEPYFKIVIHGNPFTEPSNGQR